VLCAVKVVTIMGGCTLWDASTFSIHCQLLTPAVRAQLAPGEAPGQGGETFPISHERCDVCARNGDRWQNVWLEGSCTAGCDANVTLQVIMPSALTAGGHMLPSATAWRHHAAWRPTRRPRVQREQRSQRLCSGARRPESCPSC
jgi:hypothetical protein